MEKTPKIDLLVDLNLVGPEKLNRLIKKMENERRDFIQIYEKESAFIEAFEKEKSDNPLIALCETCKRRGYPYKHKQEYTHCKKCEEYGHYEKHCDRIHRERLGSS
jgi:hypothetical protein